MTKLPRPSSLAFIALLPLSLGAAQASPQPEYKGLGAVCAAGCTNFAFNADAPAAPKAQPKAMQGPEDAYVVPTTDAIPDQDLAVDFRYSPPGGNGRTYALDNGSVLYDLDEFTIRIRAQKDLYVYVFLFDSQGKPQ